MNKLKLDNLPLKLIIILLGAVMFLPNLGDVHLFDWDEINFAESAREMLVSHNFLQVQIDYIPFNEKPPFFIWMQAISMHFFGVNEFAARLPNAFIGIATMLSLLAIGKRLKSKTFGLLWIVVYISSFLPNFYFKTAIIDPTFNLFIFAGIYFASKLTENTEFAPYKLVKKSRRKAVSYAGFFIGLAILTKGPVGLLLFVLSYMVFFALNRFKRINSFFEMVWFSIVCLFTVSIWYGLEWYVHGDAFIKGFFQRHIDLLSTQDAGHGGPFFYHFIVLLFGCFPASVFIFGGIKKHSFSSVLLQNFQKWMLSLLIVVLVVFSIVQTKIIHYSSLSYFPITFFATYFLYYLLEGYRKWKWYHALLYLVLGILWGSAVALAPIVGQNIDIIKDFVKTSDPFAYANLDAIVYWSKYEAIYGLSFITLLIVSAVFFATKNIKFGISTLLVSCAIFIQVLMVLFTPRIEKYTQNAAIEFYESKAEEKCYIETLGYKSYANLFYGKKSIELPHKEREQLMDEYFEVPIYFVCKINRKEHYLSEYPQLNVLYEKNGFVFMQKMEY